MTICVDNAGHTENNMLHFKYVHQNHQSQNKSICTTRQVLPERRQFSLSDASFLMAVQHLLQPRSKLATYNHQAHFVNLQKATINQLYRSLDLLCEYKEQLEEALFQANRNLFNTQIDMVFYDVTTFSFESVRADSLRESGGARHLTY